MKKVNVMEPTRTENITKSAKPKKRLRKGIVRLFVALCFLTAILISLGLYFLLQGPNEEKKVEKTPLPFQTEESFEETLPSASSFESGFVSSVSPTVLWYDESGSLLGEIVRGTEVKFTFAPDGRETVLYNGASGYLEEGAVIVADSAEVIPQHTKYVRTAVNFRDGEGRLLPLFAGKGQPVDVIGYDRMDEAGNVHMFRVACGNDEGYILPWYLAETEAEAVANFDNGSYGIHASRGNRYGGGGADNLDYFPREKGDFAENEMPSECRTLYIASSRVAEVDAYIQIASQSGINAFVVDITDGSAVGYAADVMNLNCPSAARAAKNTVETYRNAIEKLKNAGYYVIGRITTFNDSLFVSDHPEYAISDQNGAPLKLSGEYWPTPYNRNVWQYKVDLAVEAVQLMGFHEIQFDYVRFPDNTSKYEKSGTIDFRNPYGETKAQAIQRFLMYAVDRLHEKGVYVGADVYGESAYTYVTAYGQYWPAVSGVVDVISGMPYPDHFAQSGNWLPWEHPYEVLNTWGKNVMLRQGETATPAVVRTWIQAYNAIRKPYNTYGPDEISAQIRGLRDAGCTGGYMTWNASASLEKYRSLIPAFSAAG